MRKLKSIFVVTLSTVAFFSCSSEKKEENKEAQKQVNTTENVIEETVETTIPLDSFFTPVDTSFTTETLIIPEEMKADILFQGGDEVVNKDGVTAPAKEGHDFLAYLPIDGSSTHGWLYVGHETRYANEVLGDGGGATMLEVEFIDSTWQVISTPQNVDFTTVRGTARNCGGVVGPNGLIYTCEETNPGNNKGAHIGGKGHRDTSDVGSLKFYQNIGYIVEVDPVSKKAIRKLHQMGRYYHEDIEFLDDHKTVLLSDDYEPGILYKFIADQPDDYSIGQLYAFKEDGENENWIALPRDTTTWLNPRDVALSMGATMFMRHEWFARIGNDLYIAETGHDSTNWNKRIAQGGVPASHFVKSHQKGEGIFTDYYGRILKLNLETNELSVALEGGKGSDGKTVLSNPDCIYSTSIGGKDYLVIHEDINGNGHGRVPEYARKKNQWYTEIYFLDLSIENPTVDDLKRFAVSPQGAEFTGGIFTPDGKTYFVNVQHPFSRNKSPYNKSTTIAITGW